MDNTQQLRIVAVSLLLSACGGLPFEAKDFADADMDGDGYSAYNGDCNDLDPTIGPEATDDCDGVDSDCDGEVDEDGKVFVYQDADGDGYGSPTVFREVCEAPGGYVDNSDDCEDADPDRSPGTVEVCDGIDNDCDFVVDNIDLPEARYTFYMDEDDDGFGNPDRPVGSCEAFYSAGGAVEDNTDCDDTDPTAYPGSTAFEVPGDGVLQDCEGEDVCTDLDCDGLADVVVGWADDALLPWQTPEAGDGSAPLLVLRSDGVATGTVADDLGEAVSTSDVVVHDLDGDGYLDVLQAVTKAVGGRPATASFVHFGPFASALPEGVAAPGESLQLGVTAGERIAVGDFDSDGVADVVVGGETTAIFGGAGAELGGGSALAPDSTLATGHVHALVAADLDADGHDDLVVCHGPALGETSGFDDMEVLVLFGSATGLDPEAAVEVTDDGRCIDMAVGNLDGDEQLEIVVAGGSAVITGTVVTSASQVISVDDAQGTSQTITFETDHAGSVQLVDVNGDGHLDIVFGAGPLVENTEGGIELNWDTEVQVHLNSGTGSFSSTPDLDLPSNGAIRPLLGHFDADEHIDLVAPGQAASSGVPQTYIYYGTGDAEVFDPSGTERNIAPWLYGAAIDYDGVDTTQTDILAVGTADSFGLRLIQGGSSGLSTSMNLIQVDGVNYTGGTASLHPPIVVQ